MRNAKLLMINTVILTLGSFLMRTISVSFNIYLTNIIGSSGMGLFQLIIAVYGLAVTFASAGIKLGTTRLITEALSTTNQSTRKIIKMCLKYAVAISSIIFILMYLSSDLIAEKWICDKRAADSIKILALSLPPISVSASLNGYFTARKNIIKYSGVQLAEQLSKILITVISLNFFGNTGLEYSCFAIGFGMTFSELISAFLAYITYITDCKKFDKVNSFKPSLKKLLHITVPDAVGAAFRSILLTVEHLLIPRGFEKSGQSAVQSMSVYGLIHGIALPIILYPSAVMTSLSSLLVPELAKYKLLKQNDKISYISSTVLKLSFVFSFAIGSFIFFFADTVSLAIYESTESAYYLKLLSVLVPIMYTDMITDGLLKGLDCQAASMRYNIFDSALCVILVYLILPKYAIKGYIFILFISEIINFALSINKLAKETTLNINLYNDIIKPVICGCGCCSVLSLISRNSFIGALSAKFQLILFVIGSGVIYFICIYYSESISRKDIKNYRMLIKNQSYA